MMRFRSLEILDRIQFVFTRMGIDYPVMRRVLVLKLMMDTRRIPTVLQSKNSRENDDGNKMMKSLWMYALLSIIPGVITFMSSSVFSKVCYIMGISMFFTMTTMISDFSSVLLDIRDKNILMTLPVHSRTMAAAKTIHIAIYLSMISLTLNLFPIAGMVYNHGVLNGLLYVVMLVFMVLSVIFFSSLLYVLILKNFDGERLKDLINGIQIMLMIIVTVGYQLVGRMFQFVDVSLEFQPAWWTFLLLPAWMAGPFALMEGEWEAVYLALSVMGVCLPIVFIMLHVKVVSPAFERYLSKLNSSGEKPSGAYFRRLRFREKLSQIMARKLSERASLKFGYSILSSEREMKQKVYPGIALSMVLPFIFALAYVERADSFKAAMVQLQGSKMYLMIYVTVLMLPSMMGFISKSKHYKGAWLYKTLPMERPTSLISGTYKGGLICFGLVPYLFTSSLMIVVFGWSIIPHLLIACLNVVYMTLILVRVTGLELPFASDFQVSEDNQITKNIMGMIIGGVLCGVHYLIVRYASMQIFIAIILVQGIGLIPLWRMTMNVEWEDVV